MNFRFWDPFNAVTVKSEKFRTQELFFDEYQRTWAGGNDPLLYVQGKRPARLDLRKR